MKFVSSIDQDISDTVSCSTREIISYFKAFVNCSVYYIKKIVSPTVLPHRNRAINSNAFHDNRHMWDYHEL